MYLLVYIYVHIIKFQQVLDHIKENFNLNGFVLDKA